tara:strand:+ start:691 stop:981 length:291 start_codon:yes stop_codon:yes gene_type:complete
MKLSCTGNTGASSDLINCSITFSAMQLAGLVGKATLYGFEEEETKHSPKQQRQKEEKTPYERNAVQKKSQHKFSRRDLITLSFLGSIFLSHSISHV